MMTPMFLNNKNTEYFDLNQDHSYEDDHQQLVLDSSTFHPPSFAVSNISSLHLEQGLGMSATHSMSEQSLAFDQLEGSKNMFMDMVSPTFGAQMTSTNNYGSHNHEIFIFKHQEDQEPNNQNKSGGIATDNNNNGPYHLRWMSSKMRMMRRMINSNDTKTCSRNGSRIIPGNNNSPDQCPQLNVVTSDDININTNNYGVRVCSDCNTTKTPLWRSGPQGPKTLCNACGIRQRKARKAAMEAAAAAASAATNSSCEAASSSTSSKTKIKLKINNNKEKNKSRATSNTCTVSQHINKKQTTYTKQKTNTQLVDSDHTNNSSTSNSSSKRQMFFEEFAVKLLSKNSAFHRMFPQDEEEGALLLMTLSYGFNEN